VAERVMVPRTASPADPAGRADRGRRTSPTSPRAFRGERDGPCARDPARARGRRQAGARPTAGRSTPSPERPFAEIALEGQEAKDRIGAAAAAMVTDGQTVMLDIGTTALQVAAPICAAARITLITHQPGRARRAARRTPRSSSCFPAGLVRRKLPLGPSASLAEGRAASASVPTWRFLGTSAVDQEPLGLGHDHDRGADQAGHHPGRRARVVLLADAEKFSMKRGGSGSAAPRNLDQNSSPTRDPTGRGTARPSKTPASR